MLARQFGFVRRVGYVQGASADADGDFPVFVAVPYSVYYQIAHHALQQRTVGLDIQRLWRILPYDMQVARYALEQRQQVVDKGVESYALAGVKLFVVYLCQQQQIAVQS